MSRHEERTPLAVTVSGQGGLPLIEQALARAVGWNLPFFPRDRKGALGPLFDRADALLVFDGKGVVLRDREGSFRFHPGLAHLRMQALEEDRLVRVAELRAGDSVLDCTLGLAQDALVAASVVGEGGRVVGLEKSLALFAAVSEGLTRFTPPPGAGRVEAVHADAGPYLASCPEGAFDVVVFDPMFARPRKAQPSFEVLRRFASHDPLTPELLAEGRRVARRWVVVKGGRYSTDLKKLGLRPERASRSAPVVWGRCGPLNPS